MGLMSGGIEFRTDETCNVAVREARDLRAMTDENVAPLKARGFVWWSLVIAVFFHRAQSVRCAVHVYDSDWPAVFNVDAGGQLEGFAEEFLYLLPDLRFVEVLRPDGRLRACWVAILVDAVHEVTTAGVGSHGRQVSGHLNNVVGLTQICRGLVVESGCLRADLK